MQGEGHKSRFAWIWTGASQRDGVQFSLLFVCTLALVSSLVPLAINKSGSEHSPLLVAAGMTTGSTIFCLLLRRSLPTSLCKDLSLSSIISRCCYGVGFRSVMGGLLLTLVARLSYAAFAGSTVYLDTAVSASLYETWPIMSVVVIHQIDKARHGSVSSSANLRSIYPQLFVGLLATILIIRSSGIPTFQLSGSTIGLLLALLAPLTGVLIAANHLFVDRVLYDRVSGSMDDWARSKCEEFGVENVEESIRLAGMIMTAGVVGPILIVAGVIHAGTPSVAECGAFIGGLLIPLIGSSTRRLLRRHDPTDTRRDIASIQYVYPLLSLLWLHLFVGIDVALAGWLVLGTFAIVTVTVLGFFDPERYDANAMSGREAAETTISAGGLASTTSIPGPMGDIQQRFGLKALVTSLLFIGAFVYIREDVVDSKHFVWNGDYYWEILGVVATVFAFLFAFRLNRIETVISAEDYQALSIIRRIESLPNRAFHPFSRSLKRETILEWVRELNRASNPDQYREAYEGLYAFFQELTLKMLDGRLQMSSEEQQEVIEIRIELDALAHGRQQAREFTERAALWLLGGAIVLFTLMVPTASAPIAELMSATAAILLGSVVVFLLFHMADISRSRANALLVWRDPIKDSLATGLYVLFRDNQSVGSKRVLSIVIVFGTVIALICLLAWDRLSL